MASRLANPLTIPAEDEFDLFDVMSALTDPVRRAIVVQLAEEPGRACSNTDYGVSKSALTRHWRILRESGLIKQEARGTGTATGSAEKNSIDASPDSWHSSLTNQRGAQNRPSCWTWLAGHQGLHSSCVHELLQAAGKPTITNATAFIRGLTADVMQDTVSSEVIRITL